MVGNDHREKFSAFTDDFPAVQGVNNFAGANQTEFMAQQLT
jgi:hypothetical protein